MLPMALDALVDVMEARVESNRLEKERAAVLSEMTMVNTIEYRVECQILSTLHRENRLAKRFPIGKEKLIRSWQTDDVKSWHRTHYRPDNVLLYLVGDIDPDEAEAAIADKFGHLTAEKQATEIKLKEIKDEAGDLADAVVGGTVKAAQSWHYPPVRHDWCVRSNDEVPEELLISPEINGYDIQLQNPYPLDDKVNALLTEEVAPGKKIRPHIFRYVEDRWKELELNHLGELYSLFRPNLVSDVRFSFTFLSDMNFCKLFPCTSSANVQSNQLRTSIHSAVVSLAVWRSLRCRFG